MTRAGQRSEPTFLTMETTLKLSVVFYITFDADFKNRKILSVTYEAKKAEKSSMKAEKSSICPSKKGQMILSNPEPDRCHQPILFN